MKKNKGIAIKRIQESIKQGKPVVTEVTMSRSFEWSRDMAVEKIIAAGTTETIKLDGAFSDFSVTLNMPEKEELIEIIEKDSCRIYLTCSSIS